MAYNQASRTRYEATRSRNIRHNLVCYEGRFNSCDVPAAERQENPWQVLFYGQVANLKPEIQFALARDGYFVTDCEVSDFQPEPTDGKGDDQ